MKNDTGIAPPDYHTKYYSDRNWADYSRILAVIVQHSEPGPILDLGSGCGYLVEAARNWNLSATGLEGSEIAVHMAKLRCSELDVRLHRLSQPLPFLENSFKTVVLNQVIEHLEPNVVEVVLKESRRVLSPNGMILITSPSNVNRKEAQADPTHINMLSPTTLRSLLETAGFEHITPFNTPLHFLGSSRIGLGIMEVLFKVVAPDWLSATANARAYKSVSR